VRSDTALFSLAVRGELVENYFGLGAERRDSFPAAASLARRACELFSLN